MTVAISVTERGNISEGKTHENDFTSFSVHNICVVSIKNLWRQFVRFRHDLIIVFEIKFTSDGFG